MYMFICICACICICIWICICICTCRCRCTHRYIFTCNTCYSIKLSQQNSCVREAEGSRSRRGLARPGKGRPRPHESATLLLEYAGIHFYIHAYIQTYKDTQILYDDMGVYIYISLCICKNVQPSILDWVNIVVRKCLRIQLGVRIPLNLWSVGWWCTTIWHLPYVWKPRCCSVGSNQQNKVGRRVVFLSPSSYMSRN